MNTSYVYKAYNKVTKQFTEMLEFTSPESLLALVQVRFDALSDIDCENTAHDFKVLVDAINNSFTPAAHNKAKSSSLFTWSDSKNGIAVENLLKAYKNK